MASGHFRTLRTEFEFSVHDEAGRGMGAFAGGDRPTRKSHCPPLFSGFFFLCPLTFKGSRVLEIRRGVQKSWSHTDRTYSCRVIGKSTFPYMTRQAGGWELLQAATDRRAAAATSPLFRGFFFLCPLTFKGSTLLEIQRGVQKSWSHADRTYSSRKNGDGSFSTIIL